MRHKKNNHFRVLPLQRSFEYEFIDSPRTKPGLAYTPGQMAELWAQGIPISTQSSSNDHVYSNLEEVPVYLKRSIEPTDVWQEQNNARKKIEQFINIKRKQHG